MRVGSVSSVKLPPFTWMTEGYAFVASTLAGARGRPTAAKFSGIFFSRTLPSQLTILFNKSDVFIPFSPTTIGQKKQSA